MSTINWDNLQTMASQFASLDVQSALERLDAREARYREQVDALSSLRSALSEFSAKLRQTAGSRDSSLLTGSARFSAEGYATASVRPGAADGRYQFFVQQLASAHQLALEGVDEAMLAGSGGSLHISQDGPGFSVDLDSVSTLEELAAAINGNAANEGVQASLVRTGQQTVLVLTARDTGAAAEIVLDTAGVTGALADALGEEGPVNVRELAEARDAVVLLGGEGGLELRSASNTFDGLIDGVSLTFSRAHALGEAPLTLEIARDDSAIRARVQGFIDAFNALMGRFDGLTASGGEHSARGPLAGDASVRSIETQLQNLLRAQSGGTSLATLGIVADRSGRLTLDAGRFQAALAADPQALDALFLGEDGLLSSMQKILSAHTSSAGGLLSNRIDTLNQNLRRLQDGFDVIQRQYDAYYARYLSQFTNMLRMMESMQQTQGLFALQGAMP